MKYKAKFIHSPERRVFFCSDLHYNHYNSISHSDRPFATLQEMNKYIEDEFLRVLTPNDVVFSLGDLFWNLRDDRCLEILNKIPGQFFQVMGNHDRGKFWKKGGKDFVESKGGLVADILDIVVNDTPVTLSHFPILDWNLKFHGSYHLHGHCHGNLDDLNSKSPDLRVDVGFDGALAREHGSFLIPWDIINDYMKHKNS